MTLLGDARLLSEAVVAHAAGESWQQVGEKDLDRKESVSIEVFNATQELAAGDWSAEGAVALLRNYSEAVGVEFYCNAFGGEPSVA